MPLLENGPLLTLRGLARKTLTHSQIVVFNILESFTNLCSGSDDVHTFYFIRILPQGLLLKVPSIFYCSLLLQETIEQKIHHISQEILVLGSF